jgi:hypothetical protein
LDESLALLFTITLELLKTFVHALADLFGSLLLVVKLLFIHTVLSGEKQSELFAALLQVGGVLSTHLSESSFDDLLLNDFVGLVLPLGSESQVLVTGKVSGKRLHFLNNQ